MKPGGARLTVALTRVLFSRIVLSAIVLSGCAHKPATRPNLPPHEPGTSQHPTPSASGCYAQDNDSTPGEVPDISKIPEPVPKAEPRSQYGNKSPYSVLGESYRVLASPNGYVERGLA